VGINFKRQKGHVMVPLSESSCSQCIMGGRELHWYGVLSWIVWQNRTYVSIRCMSCVAVTGPTQSTPKLHTTTYPGNVLNSVPIAGIKTLLRTRSSYQPASSLQMPAGYIYSHGPLQGTVKMRV
jgi:hypothetical protein